MMDPQSAEKYLLRRRNAASQTRQRRSNHDIWPTTEKDVAEYIVTDNWSFIMMITPGSASRTPISVYLVTGDY
jgi:hypothetical protein